LVLPTLSEASFSCQVGMSFMLEAEPGEATGIVGHLEMAQSASTAL